MREVTPVTWLREKLAELGRNFLDALTTILVVVVLVVVCVVLFFWFLMPWHQRKVREAEAQAEAKAKSEQAAQDLKDKLAAAKAQRDAEATYRETAVKADAQRRLNGDAVGVANDIIKGKR